MPQGPEDNPKWKDVAPIKATAVLNCRICGTEIGTWHCADSGCPWCASCGTRTGTEKRK